MTRFRRRMVICAGIIAWGATNRSVSAQEVAAHNETSERSNVDAILDRRVSIDLESVSLVRAIQIIAQRAHVTVLSNSDVVARYERVVTLHTTDESLHSIFDRLFAGTTLQVAGRSDQRLLIVDGAVKTGKQVADDSTGTVVGSVVDSVTNKPIAKATVKVAGTTLSAVTSTAGQFVIQNVPVGAHSVSIRLFGYRPVLRDVSVTAQDTKPLRVLLAASATMLSGVVTTATGEQRKLEVGNAITTINVDSVMHTAPISSLTDLLETRVPGLTVQHTSGTPGDPSRIRLRGAGSINGNNDPIVIVDGIRVYAAQSDAGSSAVARNGNAATSPGRYATPSPVDQIDPNSIETIVVLKGPSAAALYGSDAANGVIVIKTKRGVAGATHWNVVLGQGLSYLPGDYPEGLYRFGHYSNGLPIRCPRTDLACQQDSLVRFQALNVPQYSPLGRGSQSNGSVTVSGGSAAVVYSLTGSASTDIGVLKLPAYEANRYQTNYGVSAPAWMRKPDGVRNWGGTSQLEVNPNPALRVSLSSSLYNSTQHRSSLGLGIISTLLSTYIGPDGPGRDIASNIVYGDQSTVLFGGFGERVSSSGQTANYAASGQWQARSWLPIVATGGLSTATNDDEALVPRGLNSPYEDDNNAGRFAVGKRTTQTQSAIVTSNFPLWRELATVALGINYTGTAYADEQQSVDSLIPGVSRPSTFTHASQNTGSQTSFGWFVEPKLSLSSRFFVLPGFRLDNNGLSGSGAGFSGFPKLNFSWVASDEPLFPLKNVVTQLRLRGAAGSAGVQPGPTQRLRLVSIDSSSNDGARLTALGNTQLRPERGTEFEGGFDADAWHGRLTVGATSYRKTRVDAIVDIPLALSLSITPSGGGINDGNYPTIAKNIGVIRNTGTEVEIGMGLLQRASVSWHLGLQASQNRNLVVRLNPGQNVINVSESNRIVPGYPLFGVWAKPIVGYADADQNGVITPSEVTLGDSAVYLGQPDPSRTLNLTNDVTLFQGRVSLHTNVAYTGGGTQVNQTALNANNPFNLGANDPNASLAEQATAAVVGSGGLNDPTRTQYGLIRTVSTIRFQTLSINYVVPRRVSRWFGGRTMAVELQGSNLGLRTNYSGKDPNVNSNVTGNLTADSGALPEPRMWALRVVVGN